jgi:RNA polymerase sigma-70 factor, ECF subfamily
METLSRATAATASADDALIQRARGGDAAAFERLVATRLDRCYRLAWSILLDEADAADATQEAFVSAWRQLPRLREPASFDGWLNRIVANAARMGRRRRRRLREVTIVSPSPDDVDGRVGGAPVDPFGRTEIDAVIEKEAIGRAFDRLRPDERLILALRHVEDRPVSEIARTLGIPDGTVKSRLHHARRALERAMEAEA